jgi:hypothetical protein
MTEQATRRTAAISIVALIVLFFAATEPGHLADAYVWYVVRTTGWFALNMLNHLLTAVLWVFGWVV